MHILEEKYGISQKVFGMSTDNASNMNLHKEPQLKHINHIKCLCHIIDLVLKDVEKIKDKKYDKFANLRVVLKYIIRKVNKSGPVRAQFKELSNKLKNQRRAIATKDDIKVLFNGIVTEDLLNDNEKD